MIGEEKKVVYLRNKVYCALFLPNKKSFVLQGESTLTTHKNRIHDVIIMNFFYFEFGSTSEKILFCILNYSRLLILTSERARSSLT